MKTFIGVFSWVIFFALGVVCGNYGLLKSKSVHAQISTPEFVCVQGYDCGQYVVQVGVQRGFGRWTIYQVDSSHIIDTSVLQQVAGGNPAASVQFFEPPPRDSILATITATE